MMITLITNTSKHKYEGNIVNGLVGQAFVEDFVKRQKDRNLYVAKDYEATGLDPYVLKPLLLGIGNKEIQFCIDLTTVDITNWKLDAKYLGHNLKYDIKIDIVHYGHRHKHLYDTMIAEQKLYQGFQSAWFGFDLATVTHRHLNTTRIHAKDTRKQFVGANPKTIQFTQEQIEYLAEDLSSLHDIMNSQVSYLTNNNQMFWLNKVEFPLVYHLAQCELNGFNFDSQGWQKNIDDNIPKRLELAIKLDEEFRRLRTDVQHYPTVKFITGGKYDKKRSLRAKTEKTGLFGIMSDYDFYKASRNAKPKGISLNKAKKEVSYTEDNEVINWGSDTQIIFILACLGILVPLQGAISRKYQYLIPKIERNGLRIIPTIGFTDKGKEVEFTKGRKEGFTTGKNSFTKYLVDMPQTILRPFIMLLMQFREVNHEINSFGDKFFAMLNPITKRLHTTYRQANAVNSRFQSGGGTNEPDKFQSQNIPRKNKFRHCFKGAQIDGHDTFIFTGDLAGAEMTICYDKSNDQNLYNWAIVNDDAHSPMIQNVWRNIFLFRAGMIADVWKNKDTYSKAKYNQEILESLATHSNPTIKYWYNQYLTFIVSKKVNAPYRQAGKNGTFGGLYNMQAAKAAEVFNGTDTELAKIDLNYEPVNVTSFEGHIILFAQREAIPDAYAFVESNVYKAFAQGYIDYDERSHSRIWFPPVVDLFKKIYDEHHQMYGNDNYNITITYDGNKYTTNTGMEYALTGFEIKEVDGQARNVPISGTQADCIKEAIVDICAFLEEQTLPIYQQVKWLIQVHDELAFSFPKELNPDWEGFKANPIHTKFEFDSPVEESSIKFKYNTPKYTHVGYGYKVSSVYVEFPLYLKLAMIRAANRHLTRVEMGASFEVANSWTK